MSEPAPKIRLHLDAPLAADAEITPSREAAQYLFTVMRLKPGARILVFNGRDGEWEAEVIAAAKREGRLNALRRTRPPAPPPDLWLLFAPLKKTRTDFVAEKACELGCRRILPIFTRHTNAERVNAERLRAHAVEAAEQCGLVFVPEVADPRPLAEALAAVEPTRRIYFCDERRDAPLLSHVATPGPGAILIGPEGGFTDAESRSIRARAGAAAVSLGPRVLRADTAAVAAITLWQAGVGDWPVAESALAEAALEEPGSDPRSNPPSEPER